MAVDQPRQHGAAGGIELDVGALELDVAGLERQLVGAVVAQVRLVGHAQHLRRAAQSHRMGIRTPSRSAASIASS